MPTHGQQAFGAERAANRSDGAASLRWSPAGLALLALLLIAAAPPALAAAGSNKVDPTTLFVAQLVVLLAAGRLLGEAAQRIGQPMVMGQLVAGILLGPSVFGALLPEWQQALFPPAREQRLMLDGIAQLGVLMLLLLTGMETDLSVMRRARRAALSVSIAGIVVPFACGFVLGELLPAGMLPNPDLRLITSLFLGIALAISSVKIVAMVVREMGFMRRDVGQIIISAAIIDDTIGWIAMSVVFGLALHGGVDAVGLAQSVLGTALFLVASFVLGRRLVSLLIRWANDHLVSDLPVISTILVIMGLLALITDAIGVHTVLGAFVAGILVGQSPILTRHIDEQLRGLIVALFMPVFFALAGLGADLSLLQQPEMLLLTFGLIAIASLGKFAGAFVGGTLGGLSGRQSLALACGMNARGSTEVIVATIGLSMGALSRELFSMIVFMAVVTTMAMPPMLRWALARLPLEGEEASRLAHEAREAAGFVPRLERLLLAADDSPSGKLAAQLAGLVAGLRRTPITVLDLARTPPAPNALPMAPGASSEPSPQTAAAVVQEAVSTAAVDQPGNTTPNAEVTSRKPPPPSEGHVAVEVRRGYDLLMVGLESADQGGSGLDQRIAAIAEEVEGRPLAVVEARGQHREAPLSGMASILVPVNGTPHAERAAELAMVMARAQGASVTALLVPEQPAARRRLRVPLASRERHEAILRRIVALADHQDVPIRTVIRADHSASEAILRHAQHGRHNLVVVGVGRRSTEGLYFGSTAAHLLEACKRSLMLVST